ncbi:hypothetical protein FEAC_14460 [Ferrimicrobium acidiphilum DSM 19497]|uniref:Uncharacterized protein n=1 Tax=Ferrimicrobium acidiphilum DSM 19497 TaxID=1121877 RepID=A0A0D8FV41_9ACTN|nr:hypothetical protein FEAC_14460 [Ferrimicrobium acidiphilum DSM 19497]
MAIAGMVSHRESNLSAAYKCSDSSLSRFLAGNGWVSFIVVVLILA